MKHLVLIFFLLNKKKQWTSLHFQFKFKTLCDMTTNTVHIPIQYYLISPKRQMFHYYWSLSVRNDCDFAPFIYPLSLHYLRLLYCYALYILIFSFCNKKESKDWTNNIPLKFERKHCVHTFILNTETGDKMILHVNWNWLDCNNVSLTISLFLSLGMLRMKKF
jgi:hypothetical protein